ncbi:Porphobilinogen deaminase [Fusobacterium necrophorum]|nr:hydroxymethylbilane synthase [Fusobacterium necrophorum]MBR8823107.1 Porphobilinogen deaminase [Fusobacterium necrophorum]
MLKHHIILGSRGSILALAQTNWVKKQLQRHYPQLTFSIQVIETQGDKDLTSHFGNSELSLKSFFTKEIEKSLLDGEIDIAVHSMKDVPSSSPVGLICGAIPVREDVRDVLVSTSGKTLADLPKGSILGTSSLRRIQNIKQLRPDLEIKALRGNIHTRLKKLEEGHYDAIVLAAAGLKRVGLEEKITEYLNPTVFSPAPAQGALYIQCREKDEETRNILQSIHDENLAKILEIEREFSRIFDGGCHTPMGCYSKVEGKNILFHAMYSHKEKSYQTIITESITKGKEIAIMAAQEIQKMMKEK